MSILYTRSLFLLTLPCPGIETLGNKLGKLTARLTLLTEDDSDATNAISEKGKQPSVIGKGGKEEGKTKQRQKQPYVRGEIKEPTRDSSHPSSSRARPATSTTTAPGGSGIGSSRPMMTSAIHPTGSKKQSTPSLVTPIRAPLSSVLGTNADMSAFDTSLDLGPDSGDDNRGQEDQDQDPIHVAMNYVPTEVPRPGSIRQGSSSSSSSSTPPYVGVAVFNVSGIDLNAMVRSGQIHNEVSYQRN